MKIEEIIRVIEWFTGDHVGMSAQSIVCHMLDIKQKHRSYPHDAADRGRCIRLLNLFPEWWDRLDEMAQYGETESLVFSSSRIKTVKGGWAEQIPLIIEEAKLV